MQEETIEAMTPVYANENTFYLDLDNERNLRKVHIPKGMKGHLVFDYNTEVNKAVIAWDITPKKSIKRSRYNYLRSHPTTHTRKEFSLK
jgi:hypothetical protein